MKVLFIGGTGTISMSITRALAKDPKWEVWLVNRGNRVKDLPENVKTIIADINDEKDVADKLEGLKFDVICDFICMKPHQAERDYRLFNGRTRQFIVISSASAYHKPLSSPYVTEGTTLANKYWQYSRDKIAIEDLLMKHYREDGFPVTIVRPSHTYDERNVPLGVHGSNGSWQVVKRMLEGKLVIVNGDGTSLWTMTHTRDFAKGFIGLMCNSHAIGEAFQITNDESLTWNQIYQCIADALGVELKPYYVASEFLAATSNYDFTGSLIGDKSNSAIFCNDKLKRAVPGLVMDISFANGIRETISHVLSHKECQKEDPEFDKWCDDIIEALEAAKNALNKL